MVDEYDGNGYCIECIHLYICIIILLSLNVKSDAKNTKS